MLPPVMYDILLDRYRYQSSFHDMVFGSEGSFMYALLIFWLVEVHWSDAYYGSAPIRSRTRGRSTSYCRTSSKYTETRMPRHLSSVVCQPTCSARPSKSTTTLLPPLLSSSSSSSEETLETFSSTAAASTGIRPGISKKKDLRTFQRYLEVECWKRADLRGLEPVLQAVSEACKQITRIVQRAQTDDVYGVALDATTGTPLSENVQGEQQQKLDVLCNTIMLRAFCGSGKVIHSVASEEEDEPRCCSDVMNDPAFAVGEFIAVFDPIDGSKNIDASLPVGSIFGVYKTTPGSQITSSSFLLDGHSLVAAGYCLYSATTLLILTLGSGLNGFTLDPDFGKFLQTHRDIRIPPSGPIYSFNEANFHDFEGPVQRYLDALKEGSSSVGVRSNARYIGSLVADVHNVLINGGIYGYPSTRKHSNGKLRLLYEAAPMAMILEQAGGAASTGRGRILDVVPKETHERVPTFLGSIENVYELDQFYKYYSEDQ